ncbi:tail fiber protein [Pseudomonas sp. 1176_21]|uniref:tail fiber protein n=1 Tax=Pseudomonas sp. 1176_21 TaxID=2604453 RepID=UPI0040629C0D
MDYPKSVPNIGLVDGHFVDENPVTGQIGSLIPAAWGDSITQEILNVIKGAGLVPDESNVAQLLQAVTSISASDYKRSVRCATTGPIALSGLQTIDGVTVTAGDRVLVKDQTNAAQNWIYTAGVGAWVRAQDANESIECTPGHVVPVQSGTNNALSAWQLSNTAVPTLGTTPLVFIKVRGKIVAPGTYGKVTVDEQGRVTAGTNPSTLAGHNITDTYTKTEVEALLSKASALPVGVMAALPVNKIPPGWLEVDGSAQSIAAYPDLAAFLGGAFNNGTEPAGYFRLPESRGEFLRGWDHGRGIDAGRELGSWQKGSVHSFDIGPAVGSVADRSGATTATDARSGLGYDAGERADYTLAQTVSVAGSNVTGITDSSEIAWGATRPRNVAVMWCIKAWNAPINQGNIDIAALAVLAGQATEANLGTARIATQAQVDAGVADDVIVTPKKLANGVLISPGVNGFEVRPKWLGGGIKQWGRVTLTKDDQAVSFPMEFPNSVRTIHVTPVSTSERHHGLWLPSRTGFAAQGFLYGGHTVDGNGFFKVATGALEIMWFAEGD